MTKIDLGPHLTDFVQAQITSGRFRNVSEVVQAGLRLLEHQEATVADRRARLRREVDEAFDDPTPSMPADEVFARLRAHHALQDETGRHGG